MLPEEIISEIDSMAILIRNVLDESRLDLWLSIELTANQLRTLMYIDSKGNVCIKEIVKTLKIAQPNATRIVDSLIKERLVTRRENPKDRRLLVLNTTAKGKRLISKLRNSNSAQLVEYLKKLNLEDLQNLHKGFASLSKVIQNGENQQKEAE